MTAPTDDSEHGEDDALAVTEDDAPAPASADSTEHRPCRPAARARQADRARPRDAAAPAVRCWRPTSRSTSRRRGRRWWRWTPTRRAARFTSCWARRGRPRGFGELLRGKASGLGELIADTPVAGVGLIAGDGSAFGAARPRMTAKVTLAAIAALDVDYVVLDLGPPDSTLTLDLWLAADIPILVSIPDPASIEATYRFAKSAFVRRLRTIRGLDRLIPNTAGPPPGALDIYRVDQGDGRRRPSAWSRRSAATGRRSS